MIIYQQKQILTLMVAFPEQQEHQYFWSVFKVFTSVPVSAVRKQTCIQTLPWFKKRSSCYFHKNVPAHETRRIFTSLTSEPSLAKTKQIHCILTAFSKTGFTTLNLQSVCLWSFSPPFKHIYQTATLDSETQQLAYFYINFTFKEKYKL